MKETAAAAAQKPAPVTVENPPEADDTIDAPLTPELKLEAYFRSIPAENDISIGVYQIDPSNRSRKGFLFYVNPDELSPHELFEKILDDWGAGEYEAIAQDGGAISFSQRFVLGSIKKQRPRMSAPADRATPPADPNILALLAAQQKTLDQLVANQTAQGGGKDTLETLRELKAMQDLISPPPAPAAGGLTDVLGIVTQVLELKDQLGGNDGESDPLSMAVKTLGPAIVKAVEAMQAAPRRLPGGVEDLGPGTPARVPTVNAQGAGTMIGPYLPTILASARGGVQPIDVARQILTQLDAIPIENKAALCDYLDDDQAVDKIAAMDPNGEPIQLREWFDQLIDVLVASLKQQITQANAEAAAAGDAEDQTELELEGAELQPLGPGREVGEIQPLAVDSAPATPGATIADTPSGAD